MQLLARAMGLDDPHFAKDEATLIREALASNDPSVAGITVERLRAERSVRLGVGRPFLPFADGAPTPSGKVELVSSASRSQGLPALPTWTCRWWRGRRTTEMRAATRCSASCRPIASS